MADEAFALSPISARATLPGEEDYAAIAEAFMETSRGRWFLTEYAKRNRNADTRMVLDAVAQLEQSLAAQREEERQREASLQRDEGLSAQQAAEAVVAAAAAQDRLTEALAAIRGSVEAAEESAVEALDSLALEQRLAPVRKGARVLREIAWRLREIGNDGRICDLIDSQVSVIEKSADQFSSDEARGAMRAAFAALQGRLVEFDDNDSAPAAETEAATPSPVAPALNLVAEIAEAVFAMEAAKAPPVDKTPPADKAPPADKGSPVTEAPVMRAEPVPAETPPSARVALVEQTALAETALQDVDPQNADDDAAGEIDAGVESAANADAKDDALLDMIAMEMGAPDPIDDEAIAEAAAEQARLAEPAPVAPVIAARAPEPVAAPPAPVPVPVQEVVQAPPPPALVPAPVPAVEMSLGSSLIASGMLKKPITAANDPLAPIRRMSQAEKIAFFS